MHHERTRDAAKGKWRGILLELGVPSKALQNRHGPCPMCGGSDRFRFDNKRGEGTWICNACGAGDGLSLAERFTGGSFSEVAGRVDALIGNIKPDPAGAAAPEVSEDDRRASLRRVYGETRPSQRGDLVDVYLRSRGIALDPLPGDLRFGSRLPDGSGGVHPAMVAVVRDGDGRPCTLHRTFLRPDGRAKAEIAKPRLLMRGGVGGERAAVRLGPHAEGAPLGIAEGIETALAASALHGIPVWAALNTSLMAKWRPPEGVSEVVVYADHDANYAGQAAAYTLAHRIACDDRLPYARVELPPEEGEDWNDMLLAVMAAA